MERRPLIVITGPTACGKTGRAVDLAKRIGGEIISADSRQLYRGMDLGTGKDLHEYGDVPYHMIDIADAGYKYNLYEFLRDYKKAERDIRERNRRPILCGGTGLYVESVLKGIVLPEVPENPELREKYSLFTLAQLTEILSKKKQLHNSTDVDTVKRAIRALEIEEFYEQHPDEAELAKPHPIDNAIVVGIDIPREDRRKRITARLKERLDLGMIEEVRTILANGVKPDELIYYGLEYKYLTLHVIGKLTYDEMFAQLEIAIHQFAKRQMTWFRGMEKRGTKIHWLPWDMPKDEFLDALITLEDRLCQ